MNRLLRTWISVSLLCAVIVACSSGGSGSNQGDDDPQDDRPDNSDPNGRGIPISGIWDVTTTDGSGQQDIAYVHIDSSGLVTEYDYDLDSLGGGLNCYHIVQTQLTALADNQYEQTDPIDGEVDVFTAVSANNLLTVSYIDVEDENNNGETDDLITETYPALVGLSVADFTECTNAGAQGTGEPIVGADGVLGHPTADLIGTWTYRSVTVDAQNRDLATQLGFTPGAVEARLHILRNSAYVYEEVDTRGGQLWAEWGFIFFNDGELDVNRQFDKDGPAEQMTVLNYLLQDEFLILYRTINGEQEVFLLKQL